MQILLADSNDLVRLGLKTIINSMVNTTIVGEARSNSELLALSAKSKVDLLVIDYTSFGFDIDVIPQVITKNSQLKVLAITPEQTATTLINALKSGVMSYVKKDCDLEEIQDAVKETFSGKNFFCGKIIETIQNAEIDVDNIDIDSFTCGPIILSEREAEIIKLIAEGLTNAEIAKQLFLSNHTVNTHRKNIMSKLGVKNTAGIVMYAVKTQLVSPNKFLFSVAN
ncbi:MAG: response regulator transcription factor [Bacteroidota bacterium]